MSVSIERRPRCRVKINRGASGETDGNSLGLEAVDITRFVRRIKTTKHLHTPVGQFEVVLTFASLASLGGADLSMNRVFVPDNGLQIELDTGLPGTDLVPVMQGFITRVFERTSVEDSGKVAREIVVTGQDAAKFLARHEIPVQITSKRMWGREEEAGRITDGILISGTVKHTLETIYYGILTRVTNLLAISPTGGGAIDLELDDTLDDLGGYGKGQPVWLRNGKAWSILHGVADCPWNEIFTDFRALNEPLLWNDGAVSPGQFYLFARQTPFSKKNWERLPTTTVPDHEIRYADTALADDERVNAIFPTIGGIMGGNDGFNDEILARYALFNRDSMFRHGAQPIQPRSVYMNTPEDAKKNDDALEQLRAKGGPLAELLTVRANVLWSWFSQNHLLHKGSWVVLGNPYLRIGQRVKNQDDSSDFFVRQEYLRRTYYIESVIQDYSEDARSYFTHLALTRGQPSGGFIGPLPLDQL